MSDLFPAAMVHLDLASGKISRGLAGEGRAVYVVFWWRGIPLGHHQIARDALPLRPVQLWELAIQSIAPSVLACALKCGFEAPSPGRPTRGSSGDPLPSLEELLALQNPMQNLERVRPQKSDATVSVIVCTRDRPESLKRCLCSLLNGSRRAEEIVVVDNAPSCDATREVVGRHPQVRYVLESSPGLDIARNTGIRHSRAQIVAFVDDDVTVHSDWVARLADCFSDSKIMAVTGLVLPAELETEAQWLFEQYWGFHRGYRAVTYDRRYFEKWKAWGVPVWDMGAGANMAFRREVFDRVGDFDPRLDVGAAGCNGDSELWYRLLAAGLTCRYEPRAVAFHYHRRDLADLRKQLYYYMRGHTTAILIQFERHRHWGNLLRLFVWLPSYYAKVTIEGIRSGLRARHQFLLAEWAGCISGLLFYFRKTRFLRTMQFIRRQVA